MKPQTPIEPNSAKPSQSAPVKLLPIPILFAVILGLSLVFYFFPQLEDYVAPLALGTAAIVVVVWMSRSAEAARQRIAFILPLLAGTAISWITGQFLFTLLGAIILIAMVLWPVLRARMELPSYLQPVLKEIQTGRLEQALQLVNGSLQAHPESWQAYQLRSTIHYFRMQVLEAERDARTALKLKPDSFYNYNALSQALLIQGHYAEAKEACIEALRLAPRQTVNHYNLGIVCYRLGKHEMATKSLAKAVQAELPSAQKLWAHYLLGRSFEALSQQDRANRVYQSMQRYRDSLEQLASSIRDKPDYPDIVLARADIADLERQLN